METFKADSKDEIAKRFKRDYTNAISGSSLIVSHNIHDTIIQVVISYLEHHEMFKKECKRQRCLQEMIDIEAVYIAQMEFYMDNYINALQNNKRILSKKDYQAIFPKQIFSCKIAMSKLWHEKLSERLTKYNMYNTTIGDIYESTIIASSMVYEEFVRHYVDYNVENALQNLSKNKKFMKYKQERSAMGDGKNMYPRLAWTFGKWPRYTLLLSELAKNTTETHPDYELLMHCLKQQQSRSNKMNQIIQK